MVYPTLFSSHCRMAVLDSRIMGFKVPQNLNQWKGLFFFFQMITETRQILEDQEMILNGFSCMLTILNEMTVVHQYLKITAGRDAQNQVSGYELVYVPVKYQKFIAILVSAQSFYFCSNHLSLHYPWFCLHSLAQLNQPLTSLPPTCLCDLDATFLDLFTHAYSFIMLFLIP